MDLLNPTSGKAVVDAVHWKEFTTETVLPSSDWAASFTLRLLKMSSNTLLGIRVLPGCE
jgi:hypothetical protein